MLPLTCSNVLSLGGLACGLTAIMHMVHMFQKYGSVWVDDMVIMATLGALASSFKVRSPERAEPSYVSIYRAHLDCFVSLIAKVGIPMLLVCGSGLPSSLQWCLVGLNTTVLVCRYSYQFAIGTGGLSSDSSMLVLLAVVQMHPDGVLVLPFLNILNGWKFFPAHKSLIIKLALSFAVVGIRIWSTSGGHRFITSE